MAKAPAQGEDVDALVSDFLSELNAISNPWGATEGKTAADDTVNAVADPHVEDQPAPIPNSGDDLVSLESKVVVAELDMRIASALDELEKEQGKVIPLPLKEGARQESARLPEPEPHASVPPPRPAKEETRARPPAPAEVARAATELSGRPIFQSIDRQRPRSRRIPAFIYILVVLGLVAVAAAWMFWRSSRSGKEKPQNTVAVASKVPDPQEADLLRSSPDTSATPITTPATPAPQTAEAEVRRNVAAGADPPAKARTKSGNAGPAATANTPSKSRPDTAEPITAPRDLPARPPEPKSIPSASRPEPESPVRQVANEPTPLNPVSPLPGTPAAQPSAGPPANARAAGNTASEQPPPAVPAASAPINPTPVEVRPKVEPEIPAPAAAANPPAGDSPAAKAPPAAASIPSTQAVAIAKVSPQYPPVARKMGISGTVDVSVNVNEQGRVVGATALRGPVPLRVAAENALKQWRFTPATENGIKVKTTITISVVFRP
jgi:TonB family protein